MLILAVGCQQIAWASSASSASSRLKAADVKVLSLEQASVPSSCSLKGEISASDGRLSKWFRGYAGREDRAIERMKEEAAKRGMNLLVVDHARTTEELGLDSLRGSVITLFATGYTCLSEEVGE
jgi:hypothetical protein